MPVRSLADLAVRALTPEQREILRPKAREYDAATGTFKPKFNVLINMRKDVQTGFLATRNHAFRRFVRKVMILRNALVGRPRLRVRAYPLTFDFWSWLSNLWERATMNNLFVNTANEWM